MRPRPSDSTRRGFLPTPIAALIEDAAGGVAVDFGLAWSMSYRYDAAMWRVRFSPSDGGQSVEFHISDLQAVSAATMDELHEAIEEAALSAVELVLRQEKPKPTTT